MKSTSTVINLKDLHKVSNSLLLSENAKLNEETTQKLDQKVNSAKQKATLRHRNMHGLSLQSDPKHAGKLRLTVRLAAQRFLVILKNKKLFVVIRMNRFDCNGRFNNSRELKLYYPHKPEFLCVEKLLLGRILLF